MTNWLLYSVAVVIWGSSWFAVDFQLGEVPVELSIVYRYLLSAAILFLWCPLRRLSLRFDYRAHLYFAAIGTCLFGLNYVVVYNAQLYIPSALNAVVFTSIVWLNILNARVFMGATIGRWTYVGAGLGMAGVLVLFWPQIRDVDLGSAVLFGAGLSLTAAAIASLGSILSARAQLHGLPVMQSNAWSMLYGTILCAVISPGYVISMLYLAIFGSVIAFWCYLTLVGRIGAHRAGYGMVMFPIIAIIFSVLFQGLQMTAHIWTGVALVLLGNLFVLGRPGGRRAAARLTPDHG
jgi:drug/metabolite transporter (DMT)-like permease